jgi:hypothetical protein
MSVFDDQYYTFGEINAPVKFGVSGLPLEDLKALKKNVDDAVDFIIIEGKGRVNGAYFVELVEHYKRISEIYAQMISVATYEKDVPAEKVRKQMLAAGQQVLLFDKPDQKTPDVKQDWDQQFDPVLLPNDPVNFNIFPTSRFTLQMPQQTQIGGKEDMFA